MSTYPETPSYTRHQIDHPETSAVAAAGNRQRRQTLRDRVAEALRSAGPRGMTDDELWEILGARHRHSVATRRGELVRHGFVAGTNRRRANLDGNPCVVWVWVADALLEPGDAAAMAAAKPKPPPGDVCRHCGGLL